MALPIEPGDIPATCACCGEQAAEPDSARCWECEADHSDGCPVAGRSARYVARNLRRAGLA